MSEAIEKARALQQLTGMAGWNVIQQYIRERQDDLHKRLLTAKTLEDVRELQGAHKSLNSIVTFIESTIQDGMDELREDENK